MKRHPRDIVTNKKANFLYNIVDTLEAGIVLEGWEVKSLREHKIQITEAYVRVKRGEAFALNLIITPLKFVDSSTQVNLNRDKKLLLTRGQLNKLEGSLSQKGYTAVPLSLYWKKGLAKMRLAVVTGKTQYDKRRSIQEREWRYKKDTWE